MTSSWNFEIILPVFVVSIVTADGLAPLGAKASAGTMMHSTGVQKVNHIGWCFANIFKYIFLKEKKMFVFYFKYSQSVFPIIHLAVIQHRFR